LLPFFIHSFYPFFFFFFLLQKIFETEDLEQGDTSWEKLSGTCGLGVFLSVCLVVTESLSSLEEGDTLQYGTADSST